MAGSTYTGMATTVPAAASALSEAAAGRCLPRWNTVRDYVRACNGTDVDLAHAEGLWLKATRHIKGRSTTGKPDLAKVHTAEQFADVVTTLLEDAGLFGLRAIENATNDIGHRIPRSTLSHWLGQNTHVMPARMLDTLLITCRIPLTQRTAWTQARARAALNAAGLHTPHTTKKNTAKGTTSTGPYEEITTAARSTPPMFTGEPLFGQLPLALTSDGVILTGESKNPAQDYDVRQSNPADHIRSSLVPVADVPAGKPRSLAVSSTSLMNELRALCRGQGVQAAGIDKQIGPTLREVCGINPSDGPEAVRTKIDRWITDIVEDFPNDLRLAVLAPLGLHPEARSRFLAERIGWLAKLLDRGPRTVRRRIDVGLTRLAEAAVVPPSGLLPSDEESGWHVSEFDALLRLDGPTPTCTERRTIRADRDGVEEIDWSITLPPASEDGAPGDLDVEVLHGVEVTSAERPTPRRFLLHLRLPRPLRIGQTHQFSLEVRVPRGQPMRPTYVFWPERQCENFRLVARFPADDPPAAVWRVDGAFHRDIDDLTEGSDLLTVNAIGEAETSFLYPRPDRGYGLQWRSRPPDWPGAPTPRRPTPLPQSRSQAADSPGGRALSHRPSHDVRPSTHALPPQ